MLRTVTRNTSSETPLDAVPAGLEEPAAEWFRFYSVKRGHHPNWLETFKRGKIRPSSLERYLFCLQLLCKDEIAHMDVRAIRLEDVQGYINRLNAMSASTVKSKSCC